MSGQHAFESARRLETEIVIRCARSLFVVEARLESWEGRERVFHRTWDERVPVLGV